MVAYLPKLGTFFWFADRVLRNIKKMSSLTVSLFTMSGEPLFDLVSPCLPRSLA